VIAKYLALALIFILTGCSPTLIPAGPPIATSAVSAGAFIMPDGARLPYRAWRPQDPARAIVVAVHGFGDYSENSFDIPASMFTIRGIAVYAYDQRGFGAGPHRGYWAGSDTLAEDAASVARLLRGLHPDTPIYLLGESMGAAVALIASARADAPPVDGYVLMAPGIRGRATMSDFAKTVLEVAARLIPAVGFRGSAPGFSPTDNEDAMRRWSTDPLTTKSFRVDAVYGLVNLMDDALLAARRFQGRVLILYGGHDRIVPASAIRNLLRVMPATPSRRFAYYPSGYHLLLRDQQRHIVATDIAEWMLAADRPLPSGAEEAGRRWARDRLDQSAAQAL
jgi:acylglycerol lipase